MSDQPTTGSSGGDFTAWDGSLTPPSATEPTTGEWTGDTVRRLEFDNPDRRYDAIADAHTAELAAEREKHKHFTAAGWPLPVEYDKARKSMDDCERCDVRRTLTEQLAAERNVLKAERLHNESTIMGLEQQLAAERERSKELSEDCEHYSEMIDKREQQLAAEREQLRIRDTEYVPVTKLIEAQHTNQQLREQLAAVVEALQLCVNTLRDKRIGTVDYMEGSRIYSDFRVATDKADAALAKINK